jgi:hypothetical protein
MHAERNAAAQPELAARPGSRLADFVFGFVKRCEQRPDTVVERLTFRRELNPAGRPVQETGSEAILEATDQLRKARRRQPEFPCRSRKSTGLDGMGEGGDLFCPAHGVISELWSQIL